MSGNSIPADVQRFIIASIDSVAHLEVALMLRKNPDADWDAHEMASKVFINEARVEQALHDLSSIGLAKCTAEPTPVYQYSPKNRSLKEMMDRLAEIYPKKLIEVTNLIHSKINKQAQQFGDAFKWQKEE